MKEQEARLLQTGSRVIWDNGVKGKITGRGQGCFFVEWDDKQFGWIDCQDTERTFLTNRGRTK